MLRADDNGTQRPVTLDVTLTAMPEPTQPALPPGVPVVPGMVPIP
ncbi:MAG: hypothetical protein U0325_23085 [Polyangiales bacterium]